MMVFLLHLLEIDDGNYYLHVFEDNVYSLYVYEYDYHVCFVVQKPRSNGLTFDFEKIFKLTCLRKKLPSTRKSSMSYLFLIHLLKLSMSTLLLAMCSTTFIIVLLLSHMDLNFVINIRFPLCKCLLLVITHA